MPVPFFNVLNGGVHSGNTMAFQEFMIAPVGANSLAQAVQIGAEIYAELKLVIKDKFGGSGQLPALFCKACLTPKNSDRYWGRGGLRASYITTT